MNIHQNILFHPIPTQTMDNAIREGNIPQGVLLEGEHGCGRSTFALELAKEILGLSTIEDIYHKDVFFTIRSDDRLPNIYFLMKLYLEEENNKVISYLIRELEDLLSRQRKRYLPLVKEKKVSYSQGIKLSPSQLEESYKKVSYYLDQIKSQIRDIDLLEFIEEIKKIQNSLDRSSIVREALNPLMRYLEIEGESRRVIFLEHIEKIQPVLVSSLLKMIEEPPKNTYFILTVTKNDPRLSKETLKPVYSRCSSLSFNPIKGERVRDILKQCFYVSQNVSTYPGQNLTQAIELYSKSDLCGKLDQVFLDSKNEGFIYFKEYLSKSSYTLEDILSILYKKLENANSLDLKKKYKILLNLSEIQKDLRYNLSRDRFLLKFYEISRYLY